MSRKNYSQPVSTGFILSFAAAISATLAFWICVRTEYGRTVFYNNIESWLPPLAIAMFFHLLGRLLGLQIVVRWLIAITVPATFQTALLAATPPVHYVAFPLWMIFLIEVGTFGIASSVVEITTLLLNERFKEE